MKHFDTIVLHHSATEDSALLDLDSIRRNHVEVRGWSDVGYHFVIEKTSSSLGYVATMARPLFRTGSHVSRANTGKIGVCLVGDFSDVEPEIEQIECAADLCAALCAALSIRTQAIKRHCDFRATACPGLVPLVQVRQLVAVLRLGSTARARDLRA